MRIGGRGELSYTNIGHSVGDWLWAYKNGDKFIKKEVLSGRETHFSLGLMYGYDFFGRYDKKRNAVTVTNLGDGEEVPEELIRILKYEFGYRAEDVIDLILERQKKYDAIDDKFKEQQRIWIRDLNRD